MTPVEPGEKIPKTGAVPRFTLGAQRDNLGCEPTPHPGVSPHFWGADPHFCPLQAALRRASAILRSQKPVVVRKKRVRAAKAP